MKIKLTAHIHYQQYSWENKGEFQIWFTKIDDCDYRTFVCEQQIEVEVPDNYDPTAQQIAALETQKAKAMSDFNNTVKEINIRISKLQALEYTA